MKAVEKYADFHGSEIRWRPSPLHGLPCTQHLPSEVEVSTGRHEGDSTIDSTSGNRSRGRNAPAGIGAAAQVIEMSRSEGGNIQSRQVDCSSHAGLGSAGGPVHIDGDVHKGRKTQAAIHSAATGHVDPPKRVGRRTLP